MTRDRRSASQQSPNFVWEALDSQARDPGTASGAASGLGREDSPLTAETVGAGAGAGSGADVGVGSGMRMDVGDGELDESRRDGRREPGTHRNSRRALIAAAVLVPLAGGSYAVVAHSAGHDDTAVTTAQAAQAPGLDAFAGSSPGGGRTLGAGLGAGAGAGSSTGPGRVPGSSVSVSASAGAGSSASLKPGLAPSASRSATAPAGSAQVPSQAATTGVATPEHTTAASAPATSKPPATAKPTQTKASRPSCAGAWSSSTSYVPGQVVSYQGQNYTATYYSTDAAPNAAISWDVWTSDGSCGS